MKITFITLSKRYLGNLGFDAYIKGRNLIFFCFEAVFSKSDFVAEYPIWVSVKRTLTGKLVVDGQNLI